MEAFLGKWKLQTTENFDEYMKTVGVSLPIRTIASTLKPDNIITAEPNGVYNIRIESTFKNHDTKFRLNEEFDEKTADDRKAKSIIKLDGPNKLIHEQQAEIPSTIIREITDPNTLVIKLIAKGVTCTRVYKKA